MERSNSISLVVPGPAYSGHYRQVVLPCRWSIRQVSLSGVHYLHNRGDAKQNGGIGILIDLHYCS